VTYPLSVARGSQGTGPCVLDRCLEPGHFSYRLMARIGTIRGSQELGVVFCTGAGKQDVSLGVPVSTGAKQL
jgi:hypothetical protein